MPPVFADFDGTYSSHPEIHGQVDAVVTGRSWEEHQDLMDEWDGPQKPVFMNPVSTQENTMNKIVMHKASIINQCKAGKYYEDQPREAAQLRILCPNTKIILVKEGVTTL